MKIQIYIHFFITSCLSLIGLDFISCMSHQCKKLETCTKCHNKKKLDHTDKTKELFFKRDLLAENIGDKNINVKEQRLDDINLLDELEQKELFDYNYFSVLGIYEKILDVINEIKFIKNGIEPYNNINVCLTQHNFILGYSLFLVYQYCLWYHGNFHILVNSNIISSHKKPAIFMITSNNNSSNFEVSLCVLKKFTDSEVEMFLVLKKTNRNFEIISNKTTINGSSRKVEADQQNLKDVCEPRENYKSNNPKVPEVISETKKVGTPGNFFTDESLLLFLPEHNKDSYKNKNESKMVMTREQLLKKIKLKSKSRWEKQVKNKSSVPCERLNNFKKNLRIRKNNIRKRRGKKKKFPTKSNDLYEDVLTEEENKQSDFRSRNTSNPKNDSQNDSPKESYLRGKRNNFSIPSRPAKRLDDCSKTKFFVKRKQLTMIVGLIGVCGLLILISYIIILKF